ncbi:hypothetical protein FCM35_KLT20919 [Carex littledalei]|uniref:Uncharacterized protein n=1 Tax=Carex littledalei TaxID=544730 RepID=A0A833QWI0_9POAL|nr:hypothetical protein FCM35_KLT20919 [Carex littledalei]
MTRCLPAQLQSLARLSSDRWPADIAAEERECGGLFATGSSRAFGGEHRGCVSARLAPSSGVLPGRLHVI